MKAKRLLSVVLAVTVVLSCVMTMAFAPSVSAAEYNTYAQYQESIKPENNYGLEETVNDGKIIQAWNWSYRNAIDLLETVAEQGFTTLQISPPNEIKMPTKGVAVCAAPVDGIAPNGWWMFYQPAGFQLNESEDNALGTKAEYIELCEKAHELGLKIIADAVINHMGTDDDHVGVYDNESTDPMDHVNPRAAEFEPELLAAKAFHSPWVNMTYKENYWDGWSDYDIEEDLTQHCTSGLPDLATETQLVQDTIYDYFVELVEAGTDGFRFDAAKHIETSHDTYFASDFWEDTLLKIRANYPDKELYAYGEILNKCGDGRPFHEYTELMDVTDSSAYWGIKDAVQKNGNGGNAFPNYQSEEDGCDPTTVNFTRENVIQWNESHDTYIDGGTSSLTVQQRNKIWALTAARQGISAIYFARPDDRTGANRAAIELICQDILLGDANITSWANPEVAAVNQFDNFFGNASEYCRTRNQVAIVERGGLGATLVNLNGTTKNVNSTVKTLAVGTYIDAITGNEFEVAEDGTITGTIGDTGIACIYYAEDTEPVYPVDNSVSIEDLRAFMQTWDASNGEYPRVPGANTIVFSAKGWESACVYSWIQGTEDNLGTWPGTPMVFALKNEYGENQFYTMVPEEYDCYIINDGTNTSQTVDLSVNDSIGMYMDQRNAEGKWTIGTWGPNFVDTTLPGKDTPSNPTEGPTAAPTNPPTQAPTNPVGDYMIGDADSDETINIKDATAIQKWIADIDVDGFNEDAADSNLDETINIKDATEIQKWIADLLTDSQIGEMA